MKNMIIPLILILFLCGIVYSEEMDKDEKIRYYESITSEKFRAMTLKDQIAVFVDRYNIGIIPYDITHAEWGGIIAESNEAALNIILEDMESIEIVDNYDTPEGDSQIFRIVNYAQLVKDVYWEYGLSESNILRIENVYTRIIHEILLIEQYLNFAVIVLSAGLDAYNVIDVGYDSDYYNQRYDEALKQWYIKQGYIVNDPPWKQAPPE